MAWIAAIGLVVGAIGSSSSGKKAKQAQAQEMAMRDRELRIGEAQEGRAVQLWNEYQTTYLPRERELVASAFSEEASPEAAAARATSEVRRASQTARESSLRNARRLGINPTSGSYAALDNARQIGEVGLEAAARDSSRRKTIAENFTRQHSALSLGRNLPATAGSMSAQAGNTYSSLGDAAGRNTDQWNALAGQAGQQMGYYAGQLADWYKKRQTNTASTGTTSGSSWGQEAADAGVS